MYSRSTIIAPHQNTAMSSQSKPIRAVEATIHLGAGVSISGYMMPDSKFRYGLAYVSILLGYNRNYFPRAIKNKTNKLKALQGKGFTCDQIDVKASRGTGKPTQTKTISFDDFCILVEHEATEFKNPKAIALLTASFREMLRSRSLVAFGLKDDSTERKQIQFSKAFWERERILVENRQEVEELILPGDEGLEYDLLNGVHYYPDYSAELELEYSLN